MSLFYNSMVNDIAELAGRAIEVCTERWGITPEKLKEDVVSELSKTQEWLYYPLLVKIDYESVIQKFSELESDADVVATLLLDTVVHGITNILASVKAKNTQLWLTNQRNCDKVMEEYMRSSDGRLLRAYTINRELVKSFYYCALQLAFMAIHSQCHTHS